MNHNKAAIILAAGKGTRMKSSLPKVLHPLAGKPLVTHVVDTCKEAGIDSVCVVTAPDMTPVEKAVSPCKTAVQAQQLGTGDAVKAARHHFESFDGAIFILYGDCPLITEPTLMQLFHAAQPTGMAILGFKPDNPQGYGRLIVDSKTDSVEAIVEDKDCTRDQHDIRLCNAGIYCIRDQRLFTWLDQLSADNAQGEYYLTDLVAIAKADDVRCTYVIAHEDEVRGVNSRSQLAEAEKIMQSRLRQKAMDAGVTMIDPDTVFMTTDTVFGTDVILEPNIFIGNGVRIGSGTIIHAFSHLEGVEIGNNASVGPFARLRPKSKIGDNVSVGNFIEVNRSEFKEGSKSKHVSYIGDAVIGEDTNIGAGTIFANYDGFNKNTTHVAENVFVGSNSTIIAPVTIQQGAIIAAGSTITHNVAADALAVGRAKQVISEGWAKGYRDRKRKKD